MHKVEIDKGIPEITKLVEQSLKGEPHHFIKAVLGYVPIIVREANGQKGKNLEGLKAEALRQAMRITPERIDEVFEVAKIAYGVYHRGREDAKYELFLQEAEYINRAYGNDGGEVMVNPYATRFQSVYCAQNSTGSENQKKIKENVIIVDIKHDDLNVTEEKIRNMMQGDTSLQLRMGESQFNNLRDVQIILFTQGEVSIEHLNRLGLTEKEVVNKARRIRSILIFEWKEANRAARL